MGKIVCPVLIVRGADSAVFTDEDAQALTDALPDGRSVTIKGAGHTVQGDNPRDLIASLRDFAERCRDEHV